MNISTVNTTDIAGANKAATIASAPAPAPVKTEAHHNPGKVSGMQETDNKNTENRGMKKGLSEMMLKKTADDLNDYMDDLQTDLGFSIRNKGNDHEIIVEIKNRKSNEVIKQIPSKELLEIKKKMEELTGLLFDHKV